MNARLQKVAFLAAPVAIVYVVTAHWAGLGLLVTCSIAAAAIVVGAVLQPRTERPEILTVLVFLVVELTAAAAVLISGGAHSPVVPLLAAPVCIQGTCLRPQLFLGCCVTAGVVAAPAILLAPRFTPLHEVPTALYLFAWLAFLITLATSGHVLANADLVVRDRADLDPLTGLFNRAALSSQFEDLRRRAVSAGFAVSLVILDVDHFKRINDEHGHACGDRVLQGLAERLRGSVREADVIYRVGGEEFLVVLPGDDIASARMVAERIRHRVAEQPVADVPITVSLGVAAEVGSGIDLTRLSCEADKALYAAKAAGRNRVVVHGEPCRQPDVLSCRTDSAADSGADCQAS